MSAGKSDDQFNHWLRDGNDDEDDDERSADEEEDSADEICEQVEVQVSKGAEQISASNEDLRIVSEANLTPTPQTPVDDNQLLLSGVEFALNESTDLEEWPEGPALVNTKSLDEPEDLDFPREYPEDYNPELEYLSDPDLHDERPGKQRTATSSLSDQSSIDQVPADEQDNQEEQDSELESEQEEEEEEVEEKVSDKVEEDQQVSEEESIEHEERVEPAEDSALQEVRNSSGSSEDSESHHSNELQDDEELDSSSRSSIESVAERSNILDSQQQPVDCSLLEETENQVTASEAQAEYFVDESSSFALVRLNSFADLNSDLLDQETRADDFDSSEPTITANSSRRTSLEVSNDLPAEINQQTSLDSVELEEDSVEEKQSQLVDFESEQRRNLIDLVSEYCSQLAKLVEEEAIKQIDLIATNPTRLSMLKMSHSLSVTSVQLDSEESQESDAKSTSINRKIYTSSMYYDDSQDSFPTIDQQVERCRIIAKELEDGASNMSEEEEETSKQNQLHESNKSANEELEASTSRSQPKANRKASSMFRKRRQRMNSFTLESSLDESECETSNETRSIQVAKVRARRASLEPATLRGKSVDSTGGQNLCQSLDSCFVDVGEAEAITDTEYEAPKVRRRPVATRATTTPLSERRSRHVEVDGDANVLEASKVEESKFKPFLDSSTLKNIEKLRKWSPYGHCNEHNSVSPEVCLKLVEDLRSASRCESDEPEKSSGEQKSNLLSQEISSSKGAKLFERIQMQSSDWVVESSAKDDESQAEAQSLKQVESSTHLARSSFSEETLMVADEQAEEIVEMLPVITNHPKAQLEHVTVTQTASFSASSRRVIECDSPDLLTSHDGDDYDTFEDEDNNQMMIVDDQQVEPDSQLATEEHKACEQSTALIQNVAIEERVELQQCQQYGSVERQMATKLQSSEESFEPFACELAATAIRSRPQSRAAELHQASLTNWRPQIATPNWSNSEQLQSEIIESIPDRNRRCSSLSYDELRLSNATSSLRDNYQRSIDKCRLRSNQNRYRNYHYPFESLEGQSRQRSNSLIRYTEPNSTVWMTSQPEKSNKLTMTEMNQNSSQMSDSQVWKQQRRTYNEFLRPKSNSLQVDQNDTSRQCWSSLGK